MLRDELLMSRYARRLDSLCELCDKEVHRTRNDPHSGRSPGITATTSTICGACSTIATAGLVAAFKRLQDAGALEIITAAPPRVLAADGPPGGHPRADPGRLHALPHALRRDPRGIWLPECGYAPGIDRYLAAENIRFFFVDSHALANAVPRPRRAVYAPV